MRSINLPAELPRCVFIVVAAAVALMGSAWAAVPLTADQQAEWLGDVYAAGLQYHYGAGLSEQSVATTRDELLAGIKGTLAQPLDLQQLCDLTPWVFRRTAMGQYPPPDLELLQRRANMLNVIGLYLARPQLGEQEEGEQVERVIAQVGAVFGILESALVEQFRDVPDAEVLAAGETLMESSRLVEQARSPVSPYAKRLLSDAEMGQLKQDAKALASEARGDWVQYQTEYEEVADGLPDTLVVTRVRGYMSGAAIQLQSEIASLYYVAPKVLTPEQQASVDEYYRSAFAAESATADEDAQQ